MSNRFEFSTTYRIPLRAITASHNTRYPLSAKAEQAGFGIFKSLDGHGDKMPLWEMGTSDDADKRAEFVHIIDEFDHELKSLAANILSQGQLQPVEVREGGSKKYTLVIGARRCLAILYNYCAGVIKAKEPTVEAKLVKANSVDLLYRGLSENIHRKAPTLIEEANSIRAAINGGATAEEVAAGMGLSEQTITNRLKLLELEPKQQRAVAAGKLKQTAALDLLRNGEPSSNGKPKSSTPKLRKPKEIRERLAAIIEEFDAEHLKPSSKDDRQTLEYVRAEKETLEWILANN